MESHLSILLCSPQRNLLFREGFPSHGNPAAQTKPGFFLSACTLVPGISTEVEQLVCSRGWRSVLLVGPSRTTPSVSEPLHERVLTCVHTCAVTAFPQGPIGTSPLNVRCCIALCHRGRQDSPSPSPPPQSGLSWDSSVFSKKVAGSSRLEFQRLSKALVAVRFGQP